MAGRSGGSGLAVLVGSLVATGLLAQGDQFGQGGQGVDQPPAVPANAPGAAPVAAAAPAVERGLDPRDGMPRVTYSVARDSAAAPWIQGADFFHPVLDTPRYSNPGTPLFPGGTCFGMVRLTKRWYDTFVKPIRSSPRAHGPVDPIENILAYDSATRTYRRVHTGNLPSYRLRAYTQPRSPAFPHADPVRTARLATAMHSDQFRGSGPFENQWRVTRAAINQRLIAVARNFYQDEGGRPRTHAQVADMMTAAIRNRTEAGPFQMGGSPSYMGFAGFVFPMFLVPNTGGGEDGMQPILDGSELTVGLHIVLAYKYREVRVRGSDGEHDAIEFRFYDVNRPELPEVPTGVREGDLQQSETEEQNRLYFLKDQGRFSFSLGYMLHYAAVDPDRLILVQEDHVMLRPVGVTDFGIGANWNPFETAHREAWTMDQAQRRPDEDFDWSRGGTGTGVSP